MDGPRFERIEETAEKPDPRDPLGYLEVLGLNHGALGKMSKEEADEMVKVTSRLASKRTHPDRHPDDPLAGEKFKLVSLATGVLSDQVLRDDYLNRTGRFAVPAGRIIRGVNFRPDVRKAG